MSARGTVGALDLNNMHAQGMGSSGHANGPGCSGPNYAAANGAPHAGSMNISGANGHGMELGQAATTTTDHHRPMAHPGMDLTANVNAAAPAGRPNSQTGLPAAAHTQLGSAQVYSGTAQGGGHTNGGLEQENRMSHHQHQHHAASLKPFLLPLLPQSGQLPAELQPQQQPQQQQPQQELFRQQQLRQKLAHLQQQQGQQPQQQLLQQAWQQKQQQELRQKQLLQQQQFMLQQTQQMQQQQPQQPQQPQQMQQLMLQQQQRRLQQNGQQQQPPQLDLQQQPQQQQQQQQQMLQLNPSDTAAASGQFQATQAAVDNKRPSRLGSLSSLSSLGSKRQGAPLSVAPASFYAAASKKPKLPATIPGAAGTNGHAAWNALQKNPQFGAAGAADRQHQALARASAVGAKGGCVGAKEDVCSADRDTVMRALQSLVPSLGPCLQVPALSTATPALATAIAAALQSRIASNVHWALNCLTVWSFHGDAAAAAAASSSELPPSAVTRVLPFSHLLQQEPQILQALWELVLEAVAPHGSEQAAAAGASPLPFQEPQPQGLWWWEQSSAGVLAPAHAERESDRLMWGACSSNVLRNVAMCVLRLAGPTSAGTCSSLPSSTPTSSLPSTTQAESLPSYTQNATAGVIPHPPTPASLSQLNNLDHLAIATAVLRACCQHTCAGHNEIAANVLEFLHAVSPSIDLLRLGYSHQPANPLPVAIPAQPEYKQDMESKPETITPSPHVIFPAGVAAANVPHTSAAAAAAVSLPPSSETCTAERNHPNPSTSERSAAGAHFSGKDCRAHSSAGEELVSEGWRQAAAAATAADLGTAGPATTLLAETEPAEAEAAGAMAALPVGTEAGAAAEMETATATGPATADPAVAEGGEGAAAVAAETTAHPAATEAAASGPVASGPAETEEGRGVVGRPAAGLAEPEAASASASLAEQEEAAAVAADPAAAAAAAVGPAATRPVGNLEQGGGQEGSSPRSQECGMPAAEWPASEAAHEDGGLVSQRRPNDGRGEASGAAGDGSRPEAGNHVPTDVVVCAKAEPRAAGDGPVPTAGHHVPVDMVICTEDLSMTVDATPRPEAGHHIPFDVVMCTEQTPSHSAAGATSRPEADTLKAVDVVVCTEEAPTAAGAGPRPEADTLQAADVVMCTATAVEAAACGPGRAKCENEDAASGGPDCKSQPANLSLVQAQVACPLLEALHMTLSHPCLPLRLKTLGTDVLCGLTRQACNAEVLAGFLHKPGPSQSPLAMVDKLLGCSSNEAADAARDEAQGDLGHLDVFCMAHADKNGQAVVPPSLMTLLALKLQMEATRAAVRALHAVTSQPCLLPLLTRIPRSIRQLVNIVRGRHPSAAALPSIKNPNPLAAYVQRLRKGLLSDTWHLLGCIASSKDGAASLLVHESSLAIDAMTGCTEHPKSLASLLLKLSSHGREELQSIDEYM